MRGLLSLILIVAVVASFGAQASELGPTDDIIARVTAVSRDQHGRVTVTLDNGQSWRQAGNDTVAIAVGNSVTISRRQMGGYSLIAESTHRSYRVRPAQ